MVLRTHPSLTPRLRYNTWRTFKMTSSAILNLEMARTIDQILVDAAIKQPKSKATSALVFLHGLGDSGHNLCEILSSLDLPSTKIICPTAPVMPVTLNRGMRMHSWFDVFHLGDGSEYDVESLSKAAAEIHVLLESDVLEGIDPSRIIFGGLSMGGALGLYSAYTYSKNFAGILAVSTWLPIDKSTFLNDIKSNQKTPILQCHCEYDPTVKYNAGCFVSDVIKSFNPEGHELKTYKGFNHFLFPAQALMTDLKNFITKVLPPEGKK